MDIAERKDVEVTLAEIIDVEEHGKLGKTVPENARYLIRVDKSQYVVDTNGISGRDILLLAKKTPPEQYRLDMKLHGGATRKVELTDVVDLATPGLERFMTLPLDQTEG